MTAQRGTRFGQALRWGAVLASGCLLFGLAWGFLDTFGAWPPLILLGNGPGVLTA